MQVIIQKLEITDLDLINQLRKEIDTLTLYAEDYDYHAGRYERDIYFSKNPKVVLHIEAEVTQYVLNTGLDITSEPVILPRQFGDFEASVIYDDYEVDAVFVSEDSGHLKQIELDELENTLL